MTTQPLVTTKLTEHTLDLVRSLAEKTGEKQYRLVERIVSAEYQRVNRKSPPNRKKQTK